jgi:hypothetical protein
MSRNIDLTKPISEDDRQYLEDRPWLLKDAELQGIEIQFEGDAFLDGSEPESVDYSELSVADLKAEIERRNAEIEDEDQHISLSGNKPDLIAALEADDEANEEDDE